MTTLEKELYDVLGFLKNEREKGRKQIEHLAEDLQKLCGFVSPQMILLMTGKISKYAEAMKEIDRQISNVVDELANCEKQTLKL